MIACAAAAAEEARLAGGGVQSCGGKDTWLSCPRAPANIYNADFQFKSGHSLTLSKFSTHHIRCARVQFNNQRRWSR